MIAACEKRRAGGRAERRRMEACVTQTARGETIEIGGRDQAAKCAPLAKTGVVDQNHKHIGRAIWRLGDRNLVGRRIPDVGDCALTETDAAAINVAAARALL
jgi:hypothetical protein